MLDIRSCLSTLSSRLISFVNVFWKAFVSELSCPESYREQPITSTINPPPAESTYISKLNLPKLTQRTDNFTTDLVRDIELGQAHFRRAEEGVFGSHGGEVLTPEQSEMRNCAGVKRK
jgi:hypothetical protein